MSDDADQQEQAVERSVGKQEPPSLQEFSKRLDAIRGDAKSAENATASQAVATGRGFRLASELLAGLIVGIGLGMGLDALLKSSPFGLLAGIFVGFGAGVWNVAKAMKESGAAPADEATDDANRKRD